MTISKKDQGVGRPGGHPGSGGDEFVVPPVAEFLLFLWGMRWKLIIGGLVGALLFAGNRYLVTRTYSSSALLLFPSGSASGLAALAGIGGSPDQPALPLLGGLLSIPQPATSPGTAVLVLNSRRTVMPLVERFRFEWAKGHGGTQVHRDFCRKYLRCKVGRDGDLRVEFTDTSAKRSQEVVTALVRALERSMSELSLDPTSYNLRFLKDNLAQAEDAFHKANTAMADYQRAHGVVPPDMQFQLLGQRYSALQGELAAAEVDAATAGTRVRELTSTVKGIIRSAQQPADIAGALLPALYGGLVEKQTKLALLRRTFTDKHPEVVQAQREVEEAQRQLETETSRQIDSVEKGHSPFVSDAAIAQVVAQAKTEGLRTAADRLRADLAAVPNVQSKYAQLALELEAQKGRYTMLLSEFYKAQLFAANKAPRFVVADPPVVPEAPNPRGTGRSAMMGMILGVLLMTVRPFFLWVTKPRLRARTREEEEAEVIDRALEGAGRE